MQSNPRPQASSTFTRPARRSRVRGRLRRARVLLGVGAVFWLGACQSVDTGGSAWDAASSDPPTFDAAHPPNLIDRVLPVAGENVNVLVYEAQGAGPHPTVVLLHGFPGFEKNLDLAQALRRQGWNVVFFHYRGTWGSGGRFSFGGILEDVAAVVSAIRQSAFSTRHRIDPDRLALVGHSMGGFAALISASEIEAIDCVASLAGANLGGLARALAEAPEQMAGMAQQVDAWSGPVVGPGGQALIQELVAESDRFDTVARAPALAEKAVLLVAGARDDVTPVARDHDPLIRALEAEGAVSLRTRVFAEGDHSFSGQRIALARELTGWLREDCAKAAR